MRISCVVWSQTGKAPRVKSVCQNVIYKKHVSQYGVGLISLCQSTCQSNK